MFPIIVAFDRSLPVTLINCASQFPYFSRIFTFYINIL